VRGGKFGIQAELNSGADEFNISQISVRMPDGAGWQTAYNGGVETLPPGMKLVWTTENKVCTMTYWFDSTLSSNSTADYGCVMNGAWINSGGKFTIELRIWDNNSSTKGLAADTFQLGVDNFAPVAGGYRCGFYRKGF